MAASVLWEGGHLHARWQGQGAAPSEGSAGCTDPQTAALPGVTCWREGAGVRRAGASQLNET